MASAEQVRRCNIEDSGLAFEDLTKIQTVSFHTVDSKMSFGHFMHPQGDAGGKVECSQHCFVMAIGDQPNQMWDAGEGRIHHDNVQDGDNFIYLADRPTYVCCNERPFEFVILFLDPAYLRESAQESLDPDRVELLGQGCLRDPLFSGVLKTLYRKYKQHGTLDRLYAESLITALCVHTLRNYTTLRPPLADLTERGLGKTDLRRALDYIGDHLGEELGLEEIASCVHISPSHFSRLFKQSVGQSPHQYVIAQRIEKAKGLLQRGNLTIGEVAQAAGFCDQSHFVCRFKKRTGLTPSSFRSASSSRK